MAGKSPMNGRQKKEKIGRVTRMRPTTGLLRATRRPSTRLSQPLLALRGTAGKRTESSAATTNR